MKGKMIFAAMSAMILAACSNNEEYIPYSEPVALQVNGGISSVATRADGTTWTEGALIGVTALDGAETSYNAVQWVNSTGAAASVDFSVNSGASEYYFKKVDETFHVAAYTENSTSLTATNNDNKTITLTATNGNVTDFLWAQTSAKVSYSNPKATLNFSHVMSKVEINVTRGTGVTATLSSGIFAGFYSAGTFNVATGDVKGSSANGSVGLTAVESNIKMTGTFIIIPTGEGQTYQLTVIDSNNQTYTTTIDKVFVKGNKYTINLTLTTNKLEVTGCTITDWTDGGDVNISTGMSTSK